MHYRQLANTELNISEVSFGAMSLSLEHQHNHQLLHQALDLGINYFDTADLYDKGFNEESLGKAFKGIRDEVIVASKVGNVWRQDGSTWDWNPSPEHIRKAIMDSLRRLQTDYLDLYQLHGGTIDDPIDDIITCFEDLKKQGWIRYYGISSIRPKVIRRFAEHSDVVSVMMQYSLLDRRPEESCLDYLHEHNISVLVRGALAKGLLANKAASDYLGHSSDEVARLQQELDGVVLPSRTRAQSAIRYPLAHPAVASVVAGASHSAQLAENAGAGHSPALSLEERQQLANSFPVTRYEKHR